MKTILKKTYSKMFKIIPFTIINILCALLGFLFANVYKSMASSSFTYERLANNTMNVYSLFAFMAICGILIWLVCANCATGLFASEIHEGTMRLLIAKEISRVELVIGKVLGMLLGSFVYLLSSLASFLLLFCLLSGVDKDILKLVMLATMAFVGYGMILIFIVGSIGTFFSSIFKKKVPAILILVAIGGLVFGIIPIIRMILNTMGYYDQYKLYLFDLNYHFGLIFNNFQGLVGNFATSQSQGSMYAMFTNLYHLAPIDLDFAGASGSSYYVLNDSLNSIIVMLGYLLASCGLYALSFKIMLKKDI